jgi:polyisoprenoid-binding protein YceI
MKKIISMMALAGLMTAANAVQYKAIDVDKSNVTFGYKQMGVAMDGKFKKFSAKLDFDPAKPAAAKALIEIDLNSVDTGSIEADGEVVGKAWFNAAAYPKATFELQQIKSTGANQFEASGKLTIKGKSVDIKAPLKYTAQGANGVFTGGFIIHRADFAIGEGTWSKFDVVANDIQVNFQLTAQSGK